MRILLEVFVVLISFSQFVSAQSQDLDDANYYQHWIGQWHLEIEGEIAEKPSFVVTQGLYNSAFEEVWIEPGGHFSKAWRAWDARKKKWEFAWISRDGFFQLWHGVKTNGIWYMHNTFVLEDGTSVLSRQAFIPQSENILVRTSEHSKDGGSSWTLRFREKYVKRI